MSRWKVRGMATAGLIAALLSVAYIPGLKAPEIAENRVLAPMPEPPRGFAGLEHYRKALDAYVADNFPARTYLIAGMNYVRYRLGYSGTSRVVVGQLGWLFYDNGSHLGQLTEADPLPPADVLAWVRTLAARTEALQKMGVPYVVLSPPVKERVYPELAPRWATQRMGRGDADVLAAAARRVGLDNVLVLRDELVHEKRTQPDVYSPFDTHWTGAGAYVGYMELMKALRQEGFDLQVRPLSEFSRIEKPVLSRPQDLAVMLGIASFVEQQFVQYSAPRIERALKVDYLTAKRDWTGDRVIDTGQAGKPTIQLVVDSFSNDLLPFLYPHFSRLVVSHNQDGFHRPDLTAKYQPDVVVVEVLESGLRHSMSPALAPGPELGGRVNAGLATANEQRPVEPPAAAAPRPDGGGLVRVGRVAVHERSGSTGATVTYHCNLESLQVVEVGTRTALAAAGWFADVANGRAGSDVELVLQAASASYGVSGLVSGGRADVAQYFSNPALSQSGFELSATLEEVPPGRYEVYLRQRYGADQLACITKRLVEVRERDVRVLTP